MRSFRLRTDLKRAALDGFALPLGVVPARGIVLEPPNSGYTVEYNAGEADDPDSYSIYAVVSHEQVAPLVERAFELLPDEIFPILEVGSRDAYRALDIFMSQEPIPMEAFRKSWRYFAPFILEDGSIGCGANSDEPFVEIFLDQWKGLTFHVPPLMCERVEGMLREAGLSEVKHTWPAMDEDLVNEALLLRSVLEVEQDDAPGLDDMLLDLRHAWALELNVDPETNVDDSGRSLGATLWHAVVIVEAVRSRSEMNYVSIWATASSLRQMEELVDDAVEALPGWQLGEIFTIDRTAYDERPDALAELPPRRDRAEVHLVEFETTTERGVGFIL